MEEWPFVAVLLGLLVLLYLRAALTGRRLRRKEFRLGSLVATLAALTLLLIACGGGGGGGGTKNQGTPAGTYTLTITGTLSGSTNLQHTTTLTLVVS
jgi:4-amino-4-deoxy-L-arabinose transferase-like glycosyltransferase